MKPIIALFCDFESPYVGQMTVAVRRAGSDAEIVHLFTDAPAHRPKPAAYLLAAYVGEFPAETVFLCVVDPGVGSSRGAGVLKADGRWYIGPENGLFELVIRRCKEKARWWGLEALPDEMPATFHGRDLFAPVAAYLSLGGEPKGVENPIDSVRRLDWPDELPEIVYIDGFGNAMTGMRVSAMSGAMSGDAVLNVCGKRLSRARTFSDVSPGEPFWYGNANGLVEIAVNAGRADQALGLEIGTKVETVNGL